MQYSMVSDRILGTMVLPFLHTWMMVLERPAEGMVGEVVVEGVVVVFLVRVMDKVVCVLILLQPGAEDVAGSNRARVTGNVF